jgi:hypothetical protein
VDLRACLVIQGNSKLVAASCRSGRGNKAPFNSKLIIRNAEFEVSRLTSAATLKKEKIFGTFLHGITFMSLKGN